MADPARLLRGALGTVEVVNRVARIREAQIQLGQAWIGIRREFDRALEVTHLSGIRERAPCLPRRDLPVRVRLFPVVRLIEVICEILRERVAVRAPTGLDGLGDRAVKDPPLALEELAEDRLAREGVTEAIGLFGSASLLLDELLVDAALDRRDELRLRYLADALQQVEGEALPDHRGDVERAMRVGGQAAKALLHGIANGHGDGEVRHLLCAVPGAVAVREVATLDERAQDLLDEERVPLAALLDRVAERRGRWAVEAQRAADHGRGLVGAESAEGHVLGEPAARELRDQVVEGVSPVQLVGPVRAQQQDPLAAQLSREVRHELERCLVRPVKVFDRDDHRSRRGRVGERPREAGMDSVALGLADRLSAWASL